MPLDKQIIQAATSRNEDKITGAMLVLRDTSNRGRLFGREGRLCVSHVNNVNIPPLARVL